MKSINITVKRCKDCPFVHICPCDCYIQEMQEKGSSTINYFDRESGIDPNCPVIGNKVVVKVVPGKIKEDTIFIQHRHRWSIENVKIKTKENKS